MSIVCIACGTQRKLKESLTLPYFKTSDKKYVCARCLPKVFPDVKIKDLKIQVYVYHEKKANDWLIHHTSNEFMYYYNNGKKIDANSFEGEEFICPYCASHDVSPIGEDKKAFSFGKAVGGALLTGGVGALAGFAGKKTGKLVWVCNNCHNKFTASGNSNPKIIQSTTNQSSTDPADEIMKYKELLDAGAITEEEFEAKKSQLLKLQEFIMKKIIALLTFLIAILILPSTVSANLKQDAMQTNDPKVLVKYLKTTKAGKTLNVTKAAYTDDNYLVLTIKKKPKVGSLAQRVKFAKNVQKVMQAVPESSRKSGIAFYQGDKYGSNLIIAFSADKVANSNYGSVVQNSSLGNLKKGTTACYFEPLFAKDDGNGAFKSSPDTQGPQNEDVETLIERIQDVTE